MKQPAILSGDLKISFRDLRKIERNYPGILVSLRSLIHGARVPCPHCSAGDSSVVIHGFIGRTLAGATSRVKLAPAMPDQPSHYCRSCERFFQTSRPTR